MKKSDIEAYDAVYYASATPTSLTVLRAGQFLDEVKHLLIEKNAKYGDSAANPMRVFSKASPVEQVLVRIDDKLSRIARGAGLVGTDEDVVKDLVGYLALLVAIMEAERNGKASV